VSLPSPAPMLLASARELPRGEGWAFEPKWDGFRCLAHLGADTRLVSRRGHDLLRYAPELSGLHRVVPLPVVLDGELVAVRSGRPSFDALHRRVFGPRRDQEAGVVLVVFDLVVLGGRDLTSCPTNGAGASWRTWGWEARDRTHPGLARP
jgi:bifunctional non-homologous end joining protein LigD